MRSLLLLLAAVLVLGGCVPLAMFASSSGSSYTGMRSDWGTYVSHQNVSTLCLSPKLRLAIWDFEGRFGRKVIMNSGFRDPNYNASVGGAARSYHMKCEAADFHIPGVPKQELIRFAMSNGYVGGVGCYPNQIFIHIDVRDRPRGWNRPVTFGDC